MRSIERTLTEAPGGELCDSNKRFDSFAPVRSGGAKWFVDGCDYLACVAEAIDKVGSRWNKITFNKSYIHIPGRFFNFKCFLECKSDVNRY